MKPKIVRTSIELPCELHRRLRTEADRRGCAARQIILAAIEQAITSSTPRKKGRLELNGPLVAVPRKPFSFTNEEIYELGFP